MNNIRRKKGKKQHLRIYNNFHIYSCSTAWPFTHKFEFLFTSGADTVYLTIPGRTNKQLEAELCKT